MRILKTAALLISLGAVLAALACTQEVVKEVPVDRVITQEVIKEVPVEKIVEVEKEVVRTIEVDRVVQVEKEVLKEVEVPGETVVVEVEVVKEVVREVMVKDTGPKETIVFSDLNWSSAQVQNRVAQYIVEKGYGYPTDVVFGATLPLFQGLRRGDTHVTMEIWLPNQDEAWMEAQAAGEVISVGESLGKDWQSTFVIPAYLAEQYPDLDSVEDLKEDQYKKLFATAATGGKARLVGCIIGWSCEVVNAKQIESYGLSDHVHIISPADGAAANADIYGAYEKGEPWLGYQWGTNGPALALDLVRLEEPAYSDECWFTTKACAFEDATVLIAVHPDLPGRAGDVVDMLRKWGFNIDIYKKVVAWLDDNPDAETNHAALWWLKTNADIWTGWVTGEAAEAIMSALETNEIPDGWPTG